VAEKDSGDWPVAPTVKSRGLPGLEAKTVVLPSRGAAGAGADEIVAIVCAARAVRSPVAKNTRERAVVAKSETTRAFRGLRPKQNGRYCSWTTFMTKAAVTTVVFADRVIGELLVEMSRAGRPMAHHSAWWRTRSSIPSSRESSVPITKGCN
jgi:hypothetical protein